MKNNRFLHYGAVLLIIAAVSAGILGAVNNFTSVVIAENARKAVNAARMLVLPAAADFDDSKAVKSEGLEFIPGYSASKELVGYVVTVAEPGYAANIDFVLGIDAAGKITGLNIIGHQETPGLGSKIMNPEWQKLWIGKDANYKFNKGTDAFVGATISPQSVYNGMMRALKAYDGGVKK